MRVEVDGLRMFVDVLSPEYVPDGRELRRRRTVVFLHGGINGDSSNSRTVGGWISDAANVVLLDRRGNGRSDGGGEATWTIERFADDVYEACVALGIEQPVVVGASYGGFIALQYAIRHPEHPAGLVVLSSGARFDRDALMSGWQQIEAARNEAHRERIEERSARVVRRRQVEAYPPQVYMLDLDLRPQLGAITCPTLLMVGTDDPVFPAALSEEVAAGVSTEDVRVVRIPGAGHLLDIDAAETVAAELHTFVERIGPPEDNWKGGSPYVDVPGG